MIFTKDSVSFGYSKFSKNKKIRGETNLKKKKISLIFFFISHLFLNKKKIFPIRDTLRQKNIYFVFKKRFWKFLINSLLSKKKDYYKLMEFVLIGKRLNVRKNLAKILSIFISKKVFLYLVWNIALIINNQKKNKNFSQDVLLLNRIKKNVPFLFFLKEYLKIKLKSFEKLSYYHLRAKCSSIFSLFKMKFLVNTLVVICFTFLKINKFICYEDVLTLIGKKLWFLSHFFNFIRELIDQIKFNFLISFKVFTLLCTLMTPFFPILSSFWLFSIIKENQLLYSSYLKCRVPNSKCKKIKIFIKKVMFPSISIIRPKIFPDLNLKEFYLYK